MTAVKELRDKIAEIILHRESWDFYKTADQILALAEIMNGLKLLSKKLGKSVTNGKEETVKDNPSGIKVVRK